jgi:microcystin-dependent protein
MEPFLGSIMVAGFNYAPKGWMFCDGQLLPVNQWQALFSLFGTTYGGDGRVNFGLPNLQGRASMGFGASYPLGLTGGEAFHSLTVPEMPRHAHFWKATTNGPGTNVPTNGVLASGVQMYNSASTQQTMVFGELNTAGGGQGHENRSPFLVLNFCVAVVGIFPTPP